jgi:hypothetical protein
MIDADDPEPVVKRKRRALVCAGVNGASDDFRLFYRIEGAAVGAQSTSRVLWLPDLQAEEDGGTEGNAETDGDEAFPDGESGDAAASNILLIPVRQAELWLSGMLTHREPTASTTILNIARDAGLASATVRRAAKNIGVVVTKATKFGEPDLWSLP